MPELASSHGYFTRGFAAATIGGLAAFTAAHAWLMVDGGIAMDLAMYDAALSNVLLVAVCFAALFLYRNYQPGRSNQVYRYVYSFGLALLYVVALKWLATELMPGGAAYFVFLERTLPLRFSVSLVVICFVVVLSWMWNRLREQQSNDDHIKEAAKLAKDAELASLRQQLQPHFLFNSLNSINALISSQPEKARTMIGNLSDFLRGTLKKDERKTVPVTEEIDQLKLYMEIEKVRFSTRLNVHMDVSPGAESCFIPPLLLQPVVENAIKHGLYGTLGEITISIKIECGPEGLTAEIRNPFNATGTGAGTGFGLSSIARRLYLIYGRNDLMTTDSTNGIFTTRIKVPLQE